MQRFEIELDFGQAKAEVLSDLEVGELLESAAARALVNPGGRDSQKLGHLVHGEQWLGLRQRSGRVEVSSVVFKNSRHGDDTGSSQAGPRCSGQDWQITITMLPGRGPERQISAILSVRLSAARHEQLTVTAACACQSSPAIR